MSSDPVQNPASQVHWLETVAKQIGLLNNKDLRLPRGVPTADAWSRITRAAGVADDELAERIANHFRLDVASLGDAESRALRLVPETMAWRYGVFPLRESDRHLVVATSEPVNSDAEQLLAFAAGRPVVFEVAPPQLIQDAIARSYAPDEAFKTLLDGTDIADVDNVRLVEKRGAERLTAAQLDAAPIVRLTSHILQQAVAARASDIHIEPGDRTGTVRFRVDGVLRHFMNLPSDVFNQVVSRIKILSNLDIADRFRPQDGRCGVQIGKREFDLRISTVPTRQSEKAVIRVLDPGSAQSLEEIGIPQRELQRLRAMLSNREGIIIVTGPTGSGKTTTLYAAIRELANGEVNITTVEDPIEYNLPAITQIQVDTARNLTFESALRSILRQDPDIIFVGEIRDTETAEMAMQASQTGHLVLATLHTNDAVGVISRLVDLGLDRRRLAGALRGVLSQRLIRRVCHHCCIPIGGKATEEEMQLSERYKAHPAVRAVGCERCGNTGYLGRIPVLETMVIDTAMQDLISTGAIASEIELASREAGMETIDLVAGRRIVEGETTAQEVHRVLGAVDSRRVNRTPRILVVDDEEDSRLLARAALEFDGYEVVEAPGGREALEVLATGRRFDAMVLDLEMPGLDGRAVLAEVRRSPSTAGLPVVVLTGAVGEELEVSLIDQGADDYLKKPLDPPRFIARVKGVLRRAA